MRETGSDLLSIPQVAGYLGLAERTILMWVQQGKLPCFKVGAVWRFRRADIDQWLETQRSGPAVSSTARALTDPVEPPRSRRQQAEDERRTKRALVEACVVYIRALMEDKERTTWVLEQFEEQFGHEAAEEAARRLVRERKVTIRDVMGLHGQKVKTLHRR
jgi:excisionase family DNA binding protein